MQNEAQTAIAPLTIGKFQEFQKRQRETAEAAAWLNHIGAHGRGGDVLHISPAHCALKVVIAGQYVTGGQNYWDSPVAFNVALLAEIFARKDDLFGAAMQRLRAAEAKALVAAKSEIEAISAAIELVEA